MTREHDPVETARNYYNSSDADNYYHAIWGGEFIHIGLYETPATSIAEASQRTTMRLAERLSTLDESSRVLDLGAGYGATARYLAGTYGCRVVALNLSEVENRRSQQLNQEQGLDHLIEITEGNFEQIPYPDGEFDCLWSQDAMVHSGDRARVMEEAARVLRPKGEFVFTDIMMADGCSLADLQPVLDRIHLSSLGSPSFYKETADSKGLEELAFIDLSDHLVLHYQKILEETERREPELADNISQRYLDHMKRGLQHWVDSGARGDLVWGIFHFQKPKD